ncbi:MAG: hypothetical protein A3F84_11840 [Candidatus Handelsmanbacteria bacterium RIFCSPLOWO2_12_FULL_64_10]|uniref:Peptidase M14 domain-containing protein n=1 Tax=Handelsmanbacteria sp. (strain RIFCSPLOWO2_12_FULL_64_10) TaxID=1817868 RepID=A0A1F6C7Q6_HANXR|nr:MAG: hypothetical protein A3F84_11840 [Candidatus Handelsmanbacteria bacterium RIFCSPLOWO2_12_FULL_64_10]
MTTIETDGLVVSSEIEGGNADGLREAGPGRVAFGPREDPIPHEVQVKGPISCYVVCVQARNPTAQPRTLTLDVEIPRWLIGAGFDYFLKKTFWARPEDALDWSPLDPEVLDDCSRLRVTLRPGETRILSSTASYPYSWCCRRLEALAGERPDLTRLREIGRSGEGRPILALDAGRPGSLRRAVFTGTSQPGEPAAWAVLAMADAILNRQDLQPWLKDAEISFVPQPNPDGVVAGACNANARGEMVFVGFEEIAEGQPGATEALALWGHLSAGPPAVYVDYHFLPLPNHPLPRPYVFSPDLYTDAGRRTLAERLTDRYIQISGCPRPSAIPVGHPLWRNLATYQAAARWNTVSFLYQYTGPTTSHLLAQQRGPEVMQAALEICLG